MSLTLPQIKRANVLSRAGLSDAAVAVVLTLDGGVEVKADSVRYYRVRYGMGSRPSFRGTGVVGVTRPHAGENFNGQRTTT